MVCSENMLKIPLFPFEPECPDYHWTICETTFTICLVLPVESSNGPAHFRCEWFVLRPLSLQMRKWSIFLSKAQIIGRLFFVEKSIKHEFQILILPSPIDRHDNQVGRWLTNFRATWDPKFDSYAVVGSMKQPRQVRLSYVCGFSIVCPRMWSRTSMDNLQHWLGTFSARLLVSDPTCTAVL